MPAGGLPAWESPDPALPSTARLDPHLEVQRLTTQGDWAQVACANGWTAWLDAKSLIARGQGPPAPRLTSTAQKLLTTPRAVAPGSGPLALAGPFALAGAALIIAGSLLPLFSADTASISTWQLPVGFLFTDTPDPSGFKLGVLLLSAALVAIPVLTARPLAPLALLVIAAPAANTAVGIYLRKLRTDQYPNLGVGLALIMAGAILIAAEALIPCWSALKERAP